MNIKIDYLQFSFIINDLLSPSASIDLQTNSKKMQVNKKKIPKKKSHFTSQVRVCSVASGKKVRDEERAERGEESEGE